MSKARMSITIYGIYLATGGAIVAFIPNVLLSIVGLPPTHEVWIRLFGCLALVLGLKGVQNSRAEVPEIFQMDVYTRSLFATFLLGCVLLDMAPRILLFWTVIDYSGALWTQLALRADKRAALAPVPTPR
jgi:hypothetical protein